ncbi:hypothetical protein TIFTF001_020697 [Ficus carica]|uniref:Aminotransferase-like plant mobile domain-containing protein n=1 Tax=Ficus carica TaxID=3494 RepID=A0AA88AFF6_FICCA|nr:hypothetical protein TIFTF001_020697 [Ficus carica]
MVEPSDMIFEEREELMVSSSDENPVLRTAHFLKPSSSKQVCKNPTIFGQKRSKIKVHFRGWRYPKEGWRIWVESMEKRYQSTWKMAGIHEAIMGSIYIIKRERDFVLELAQKWCSETNSFIFPWGEATLTLEDMKVLGGFPVLGEPVLARLNDQESVEIKAKLIEETKEAATIGGCRATGVSWMKHFMGSGSDLEHEAFLSLWLSWFVFPTNYYRIGEHVFPIAIRLARGTRIALAPAVLSSLYHDLRLMKQKLSDSEELIGKDKLMKSHAPFQLVKLWGWERFPKLGPEPMPLTDTSKPRRARWHSLSAEPKFDFSSALDSAGESFLWRPYASSSDCWLSTQFNLNKEQWVLVGPALDEELETLARCLRVSELVGLNCIEQYLPHRVAKQFGMDQDVPLPVARCNWTPSVAWSNYNRPIRDEKLYIPSRHSDSGVTIQYSKWWNHSMRKQGDDVIKSHVKRPRDTVRCPRRIGAENKEMSLADSIWFRKWPDRSVMKQDDDVIKSDVKRPRITIRSTRRIGAENEEMSPEDSIHKCPFRSLNTMELEDSVSRGQGPEETVGDHDDTGKGFELPNAVEPPSGSQHQTMSISAADDRIAEETEATLPVLGPTISVSRTTLCANDVSNEAENTESAAHVIDLTNEESEGEIQVPGLKLEARIGRLERTLEYLKKTRYPQLCKVKKPIRFASTEGRKSRDLFTN